MQAQAERARPEVIAFSSGMLANVLIDQLWPTLGGRVHLLDFGALFDIYVGHASRSWARTPGWPARIARNLEAR